MKAVYFPYKTYKGDFYPIIKIQLKGPSGVLITEAYVDSGASISIFSIGIASDLGIDYKKGKTRHTMVGDGNFMAFYVFTLPVKLGPFSFRAKIGFSPNLKAGINLIGQKDFFDRFVVTFNKRKRFVSFKPSR